MGMMRDMWSDEDMGGIFKFFFIAFPLIIAVVAFSGCRESIAASACRAKGYSGSDVTYGGFGSSYCIRRVGLVDEVVPL